MKELQESLLALAVEKIGESFHQVAEGMKAQTEAINRLAESNETLAALIYQSMTDESDQDMPQATYLSGKAKG